MDVPLKHRCARGRLFRRQTVFCDLSRAVCLMPVLGMLPIFVQRCELECLTGGCILEWLPKRGILLRLERTGLSGCCAEGRDGEHNRCAHGPGTKRRRDDRGGGGGHVRVGSIPPQNQNLVEET